MTTTREALKAARTVLVEMTDEEWVPMNSSIAGAAGVAIDAIDAALASPPTAAVQRQEPSSSVLLAEQVLHMDMVTEKGKRARALARQVLAGQDEALRVLRLIEHATAPSHEDGGYHEAAHELATAGIAALSSPAPQGEANEHSCKNCMGGRPSVVRLRPGPLPSLRGPDLIERLTYHALERDDLTLDEVVEALATGWKKVRGRTERAMLFQLCALMAGARAPEPAEVDALRDALQNISNLECPEIDVDLMLPVRLARAALRQAPVDGGDAA